MLYSFPVNNERALIFFITPATRFCWLHVRNTYLSVKRLYMDDSTGG